MKFVIPCCLLCLLVNASFAGSAREPSDPGTAEPAGQPSAAQHRPADTALLHDPFSPIGYRLPEPDFKFLAGPTSDVSMLKSNVVDLKAKARALLKVRGIVKSGNTYVANVNGAIVKAGDEIDVKLDGKRVVFIIRSISLKRVEMELRE